MRKQKRTAGGNEKNRNTSYYKSQIGKRANKEKSDFLDRAKKRQMNSYRLAMLVLFLLMVAFTGLILLGAFLRSLVGTESGAENTGDSNTNIFTTRANSGATSGTEPVSVEAAQPVDISEIFYNYNGAYLDVQKLENLESLQYFIDNVKSKGVNAVNIDIKKEDGTVPYHINGQTDSVIGEENLISIPIEDIIKTLRDNGLYVSGTIACFKDNLASTAYANFAIRNSSTGMRWEDSDGYYWLNPYSDGARDYIKGIIEESARLGFDEIILSWFFFPDIANEKTVSYQDNGMDKYALVKDFITAQRYALDDIAPKMKLGLNIPLKYFLNMPNDVMGLNPGDLADRCNFFTTSFAPADVPAGVKVNGAAISNPESNIYETVKALCGHFKYISDIINFRPYIQAFNGYGDDRILNQKQALYDCGINMWQLVNFDNSY